MDSEPKIDFGMFVSGLMAEGMVALGVLRNPMTNEISSNLKHASYVIDALDMLKTKTSGNLTKDEAVGLEQGLYQLRMLYVRKANEPSIDGTSDEKKETENR